MTTVEEFVEERYEMPEGGRWCELVAGEAVQLDPPDDRHSTIVLNLTKAIGECLQRQQETSQAAYACYELGLVTSRDPDTVRCPPVSLFVGGQAFAEMDREWTETQPDLVIELATSPMRRTAMADRVLEWHQWGVPLVWVVDSTEKSVHVARPGEVVEPRTLNQSVSGEQILPALEIPVRDLFVEPEWWTTR